MVPAATTRLPNGAVDREAEQRKNTQRRLLRVSGTSRLQFANKPCSQTASPIIRNKKDDLTKRRKQVDKALQSACARQEKTRRPRDYLSRQYIVKLDQALARREARLLRARTKAKRLYKWAPSIERHFDLNLHDNYLSKIVRRLGSSLPDRKLPFQPGEFDDGTSSGASQGDDVNSRADMASDSHRDFPFDTSIVDNARYSDSDCDFGNTVPIEHGFNNGSAKVDSGQSCAGLDGAVDQMDRVHGNKTKRKFGLTPNGLTTEQERRKKAKKEHAATKQNDTASHSKSTQSEEDAPFGQQAAIDSIPRPSKLPKVMIKTMTDRHGTGHSSAKSSTNDAMVDRTTTDSATTEDMSLAKIIGKATTDDKIAPADSITPAQPSKVPANLPWYQIHAKRQLQDDFNDCVRTRPKNRCRQRQKLHYMSGACASPHSLVSGDTPCPQDFSPPSHQSSAASYKTRTLHKRKAGGSHRKNRSQKETPQSRPILHSSRFSALPKARTARSSFQKTGN
ncbi:unnamed protein product [Discula destructiva]